MRKLRVAVLMGGPSSEHDISLETGKMVLRSLARDRYEPFPVVVPKERDPKIKIKNSETDMAFIAMHGEYGEDGTVQALLEALGVPYTGSGVLASALAMSKPLSSRLLGDCGLSVPDFVTAGRHEFYSMTEKVTAKAARRIGFPAVIKPADRGSSVGLSVARDLAALRAAIARALRHSRRAMIQRYIAGREVTCGVIHDDEAPAGLLALEPTEIIPRERAFFDYYSKYTAGASEEVTPPRMPSEAILYIQKTALAAHRIIGASGMSRTDMILDKDGYLHVLEVNTIPGMTPASLLPQAARASGISFPTLLDKIIAAALRRFGKA